MSWHPALDPHCPTADQVDAIDTVIVPRAHDPGGCELRRALPAPRRQMVGPFIFFDQMGPAEFLPPRGLDVRPHPHIGLATISYLYRGRMHHRDSLGTDRWIEPGAVNWMVAGNGITHSERTDDATQAAPIPFFGVQTWVALPANHEDRGVHVVEGGITVAGQRFDAGQMMVFRPGDRVSLRAGALGARLMLLGGATLEGPRHIWWNFVTSSKARIEEARQAWRQGDWQNGRFSLTPGDDAEFIPLP